MKWAIVASFLNEHNVDTVKWLDNFVPEQKHHLIRIPRRDVITSRNFHNRASKTTSLAEWKTFWNQSEQAWKTTPEGIIAVFPQPAVMVGLRQSLFHQSTPVVAWCFNIGACYPGIKQHLSSFALKNIDRFVVHSRREMDTVSQWLKIPKERFEFVPLQREKILITEEEERINPFILAMGSANRDYHTLFRAVEKLGIRTIVVASAHSLSGLDIPSNVEIHSGITIAQCRRLAQKARLSVVPLLNTPTAAGQITITEAMMMSRPVIATDCAGSEDYIQHGKTGILVKPGLVNDLIDSIEKLWSDPLLRSQLAKEAGQYAAENFSEESVGAVLTRILDKVAKNRDL